MSVLEYVINQGFIDPDKLYITGGSDGVAEVYI